ncbi:MAG: glucose-6-phosphate isomerase [Spirochaetia bacterium]
MTKLQYKDFDQTAAYKNLKNIKGSLDFRTALTEERISDFECYAGGGLTYNYAAKSVDSEILQVLQDLADEQQLIEKYRAILSGEIMNTGEKRKVLHHLCRGEIVGPVEHNGKNLRDFYTEQQSRIRAFADKVHSGEITGSTGQRFTQVVQIGIGGSDLGPRALYLALENHVKQNSGELKLKADFISNVDPDDANSILSKIDPETTLFILVSKSGTTQETLTNENLVLQRIKEAGIQGLVPEKHMIAVTSETSPLAKSDSYLESFYIDDFIGGRYSSTSAVGGAVLSLAFGPAVFEEILEGANKADKAALAPNIRENASLLDAMIGVYERNFLGLPSTAVLPYSQALSRFPAHLQQLDMESNGKQVNRFAEPVSYQTGPVIFGEPGTNGQHSFYQLLHQGTDIIPLQFIGFQNPQIEQDLEFQGSTSQTKLNANLAAQILAFAKGKQDSNKNKNFPGGRPSSLLYGKKLTPQVLGALLAHFENKVMFQGLTWNVNSFDQEGVQLGKVLTKKLLSDGDLDPALKKFAEILGVF